MLVNSIPSKNNMQLEVVHQDNTVQETTYYAALKLVARIDEDLTDGVHHYRDRTGQPSTIQDDVVRAILPGPLPEEV